MYANAIYAYRAYKPSGVPWLGDVPEHWDLRRGGWLFHKMDRPVRNADEVITCFRDGTVTLRKNRRMEGFTESLKEIGYQGVRMGDLVIHQMDAFAGAVGVSDSDGKGTPVYSVCHPTQNADPFYYAHIVREMARNQWILALAKGIRERSTDFRYSEFAKQALPLPPLPEQAAIARYLDHVDRRIRRYVTAKRKLIALLEEEKQAIVNQAVTQGLDPNVRLKPSGVEWLGEVPEHWEVVQLGRIGKFSKGGGGTKEDEVDVGLPCIRYGDIYMHHKYHIERSRSYISLERSSNYTPMQYGDILFAGSGETIDEIGKSAVNLLDAKAYCGGDVILFRPGIEVNSRFTGYATDCVQSAYQKSCMGRGITIMHIYSSQLKYMRLALPPVAEQSAIAEYLDKATTDVEAATARARRQIELVQEYRTRLIADVVTGKLDVSEAAALLPDEADDEEPMDESGPLADSVAEDLYDPDESVEGLAMESEVTA